MPSPPRPDHPPPEPLLPDPLPLIDALERAHDGPVPPLDRAIAAAGGIGAWRAARQAGRRAWAAADCAEARLATARRRAMLTAGQAPGDAWLARLVARLAGSRAQAVR